MPLARVFQMIAYVNLASKSTCPGTRFVWTSEYSIKWIITMYFHLMINTANFCVKTLKADCTLIKFWSPIHNQLKLRENVRCRSCFSLLVCVICISQVHAHKWLDEGNPRLRHAMVIPNVTQRIVCYFLLTSWLKHCSFLCVLLKSNNLLYLILNIWDNPL